MTRRPAAGSRPCERIVVDGFLYFPDSVRRRHRWHTADAYAKAQLVIGESGDLAIEVRPVTGTVRPDSGTGRARSAAVGDGHASADQQMTAPPTTPLPGAERETGSVDRSGTVPSPEAESRPAPSRQVEAAPAARRRCVPTKAIAVRFEPTMSRDRVIIEVGPEAQERVFVLEDPSEEITRRLAALAWVSRRSRGEAGEPSGQHGR